MVMVTYIVTTLIDYYSIDIFRHSNNARAVDWLDFLLYLLPTIVYEQIDSNGTPQEAKNALLCIVTIASLALQQWLDADDIDRIKR